MSSLPFDLESESVALPPPRLPQATLEQALQQRRSERAFAPGPLGLPLLSALLWAAFGVNRPQEGGRTAPSAMDWQETGLYAVLPEGAYRYDARAHSLRLVRAEDLRAFTGLQDFVATAPLELVYVADFERMAQARDDDERRFLAGADAGFIAQNVYLCCAAAGLATVVRALIDRGRLAQALGLTTRQRIALAQSVGWPAAPSA